MVSSPQINAIVCIRKGRTPTEILEGLKVKGSPRKVRILEESIHEHQVRRALKKDVEEAKKEYEQDFHILDIWFISSLEYWEHDPPERFDKFWEKLIFPENGELEDHIETGEDLLWNEDYSDDCIILFLSRLLYT